MYSNYEPGEKVISVNDWNIYEIIAVRHVTYKSNKSQFMNTYLYLGKGKWINSKSCISLTKKKNR